MDNDRPWQLVIGHQQETTNPGTLRMLQLNNSQHHHHRGPKASAASLPAAGKPVRMAQSTHPRRVKNYRHMVLLSPCAHTYDDRCNQRQPNRGSSKPRQQFMRPQAHLTNGNKPAASRVFSHNTHARVCQPFARMRHPCQVRNHIKSTGVVQPTPKSWGVSRVRRNQSCSTLCKACSFRQHLLRQHLHLYTSDTPNVYAQPTRTQMQDAHAVATHHRHPAPAGKPGSH
jgi:hypothetical protein